MNFPNRTTRLRLLAAMIATTLGTGAAYAIEPIVAESSPAAATPTALSSTRLIVRYRDPAASDAQRAANVDAAIQRAGAAPASRATRGARTTPAPAASRIERRLGTGADLVRLPNAVTAAQMRAIVAEVAADPAVAYAQVDQLWQHTGIDAAPQFVPNDPFYGAYQWHLKATAGGANVEAARDLATGDGIVVAVLDTGIVAHPDMDANVLPGYDFIIDPYVSRRAEEARVPGALDLGDWTTAGDCGNPASTARRSSFHGTHVTGTVAELTHNGVGMAGVAPGAKVLPVRVLGRCGGYTSDIADAITWASGGTVDGVPTLDPANRAEIINMSLGGGGSCDAITQEAIDGAVSRGTLVVVAAGNSNGDVANFSPASCNNVVSVAAAGITGARAPYSNYGALIDLTGPGGAGGSTNDGYVWQVVNSSQTSPDLGTPSYGAKAGTSMAAPHVAGVAALVQSVAPTPLTPAALEALLVDTVRGFPVNPDRVIGAGLLDATLAVNRALLPPGQLPVTVLLNKAPRAGVAGGVGKQRLYSINVPAGARILNLMTYGGSGDVSLYSGFNVVPTTASTPRSIRPGNNETVRVLNPAAGTYYMLVVGDTAYAELTVQARID